MLTSNARLHEVLRSKYVSTDAHSVSIIYSDKKSAHACHLPVPVNQEILSYKDTKKRGITGEI